MIGSRDFLSTVNFMINNFVEYSVQNSAVYATITFKKIVMA